MRMNAARRTKPSIPGRDSSCRNCLKNASATGGTARPSTTWAVCQPSPTSNDSTTNVAM